MPALAFAVSVIEFPAQTAVAPPVVAIVAGGSGFCVIVIVAVDAHAKLLVIITDYCPAVVGAMLCPDVPSDHA